VEPEFVGSQACRKCHPDQFQSFLKTKHSRSLVDVVPELEPADGFFDDASAGRRYRSSHLDGRIMHDVCLLMDDGTEALQTRFPAEYRFGSGHFGRGYLVVSNGFFVQSPIVWFEARQAWGLSPGIAFEGRYSKPFGRGINEGCLSCHSGHIERSTVSDLRMRIVEPAIGCERCHGPGKSHVEQETAGRADSEASPRPIINPRLLSRKRSEAICRQCHLQGDLPVRGRNVHAEGFRAGEPLEKYRQDYLVRMPRSQMQVVGQAGQLSRSACYRKSETLTCVTCHDPHVSVETENRAERHRTVCLSCHQDEACRFELAQRLEQRQNDCTACHMPAQKTDIPHVALTHHQIGKHPVGHDTPPADEMDLLVPLFEPADLAEGDRQRSLGLAWMELLSGDKASGLTQTELLQIWDRAEKLLTTLRDEYVDPVVVMGLARLYSLRGDKAASEVAARRVLKFKDLATVPQCGALSMIASTCFEQRRPDEAADCYAQLTRLRRNAQDWFYLGMCEYEMHHVDAAIAALKMARTIDPDADEPRRGLARIYSELKKIEVE
jgi:predicted CXXCH cytochrome family protein